MKQKAGGELGQFTVKVEEAGGNLFANPVVDHGWMYDCVFAYPDGHRWNVLYMNLNKLTK